MNRGCQSSLDNLNARAQFTTQAGSEAIEVVRQLEQGAATTGHDPFLHRSAGGIEGIFDPQFAVLEFGLGGSAHLDHSHAARQLGNSLIQFFPVVVRIGRLQLPFDRGHPFGHRITVVFCGNDRGALLADRDATGFAQIGQGHLVQGHGPVFTNHRASCEDRDVCQGRLATFPERWRPHSGNLQHASVFVDHQRGEGFAFHLFGQDQQG